MSKSGNDLFLWMAVGVVFYALLMLSVMPSTEEAPPTTTTAGPALAPIGPADARRAVLGALPRDERRHARVSCPQAVAPAAVCRSVGPRQVTRTWRVTRGADGRVRATPGA